MQFSASTRAIRIILLLQIFQNSFIVISCYEFDKNYFGVTFLPYVKPAENWHNVPSYVLYTRKNIETMMTTVSGKFSHVLVIGAFTIAETYTRNITYHRESYASVYSGEVAAQMKRNNTAKNALKLLYHVPITSSLGRTAANVLLAFEASERANIISSGTVEGISIDGSKTVWEMQQALHLLQLHKETASKLDIKLGAQLDCSNLINQNNDVLALVQRQIINQSDFTVCTFFATNQTKGATAIFKLFSKNFVTLKEYIHAINPKVEVIARAEWSSFGTQKPSGVENLKVFWQMANDWAVRSKCRIFVDEAFDNPWKSPDANAHLGWWKLKTNADIDSIDSYVEKVSGNGTKKEATPGTSGINIFTISAIVVVTLIGLLAVVFFLCFNRRRKKQTVISSSEVNNFIHGSLNQSRSGRTSIIESVSRAPYDASLEIPRNSLKIDKHKTLGSGEFGVVFEALIEMEGGCVDQVALKVAKDNCQSNTVKGFLSEIKILSYLGRHPNIVALKGAYTAELNQGIVYVATELCALGSLEKYLRRKGKVDAENEPNADGSGMNVEEGKKEIELTPAPSILMLDMVRWSHEIACGMEFLEGKHVVHADLATRNVLLTADKVAKITDFGLSRRMYNYTNYVKTQQEPLPWRWMAIEALKKMDFSSKSDVWSYGITLWEIFSQGDVPYPGLSWTHSFVTELVNGLRPDCPQFATPEIYNIMRDCWNLEAKDRPNFSELAEVTLNVFSECRSMASNNICAGDLP